MNSKNLPILIFNLLLLLLTCLFCSLSLPQVSLENKDSVSIKDISTACQLMEKGKKLSDKERYSAAIEIFNQAQVLYSKHGYWEEAVKCVLKQAGLGDYFDTPETKLEYSQLGVYLAQEYLPQKDPLFAVALRQKAEALIWKEEIDSANQLLLQAIPLFEEHCFWEDWAWSEIILGMNYLNAYELKNCQKHLAVVGYLLKQQVFEENDDMEIQSTLFSLLGVLYQIQGDYDRAIQNTKEAIQLEHTQSTIDSTFISASLNNLGIFYQTKGDYQRALDHFMRALYSHQDAAKDYDLLFNIGNLFSAQKKYNNSIDYYHKGLLLAEGEPNELKAEINAFNNLGENFKGMGIYDSSFYYCQKAIDINLNYRKGTSWNILGEIAYEQKQKKQAIAHFSTAIKTYQKDSIAESSSPFYLSKIYTNIANAYVLNGNMNQALQSYQKAFTINHATFRDSLQWQKNPSLEGVYNPRYFLKTLHGKAKALTHFSDSKTHKKAALETYQLLIQWADSLQVGHATETASLDWTGLFKQIYGEAIEVAYHHYKSTQDLKYLDMAFAFSEKSKNSLLLESLKAAESKTYAGISDSLLQKEKDLKLDMAFYERALQEAKTNQEEAKIKLYEQYFFKIRLELAALKEQLEQDFPQFYALKYGGKIISVEEVQSKILDKETAFLEYFIGDSTAFVFVITQEIADLIPLKKPSQIKEEVVDFRQTLLDTEAFYTDSKATVDDYQQKAISVYQSVLQPVLAALPSEIQQLVIVPDEFLNSLPFEALITAIIPNAGFDFGKLAYVLQEYQVGYAYSADLLLNNQERQNQLPANGECLAFAPTYGEAEFLVQRGNMQQLRSSTENLEGTALEIQAIARFFDGRFEFGEAATESQFKKYAPQFGILHLAMHGVPNLENANFNHLKFTNIAKVENDLSQEDNLLHHYEIAGMDLQAQLAVLSACETGIGKYEKGEGVYSLARSFMYAGVPSVVMSLWKVSDKSTSQLMPFFYESLADGVSKSDALSQAKSRFLQEASMEYRHPFYWSAFVLLGDADILNRRNKWWVYLSSLIIGMLVSLKSFKMIKNIV